ncbi:MAG TPA: DUF305 domain-containing protein [Gemmatimonadaceae bacterium]|nr:DUF305 domain-containing protein [Gemmatimonadaceae bacterium]
MHAPLLRGLRRSVAVVAVGAATACAPAPAPESGPAPAAADTAHQHHAPASAQAADSVSADVRFLQHMIPHHAQALAMTALVPSRTTRTDVRMIAERITVSQRDEIATMQRWLEARGAAVPPVDTADAVRAAARHAGMAGMLTPDQLNQLAAARGPEFDRLFLTYMIQHHRGAVTMVAELLSAGGAQEPQLFGIASEVESDQLMEIARMERILATMPSASPDR